MMARQSDRTGLRLHPWLLCAAVAPLLLGCAATPGHPYATANSVLAEQYRAGGTHGALTGDEAGQITGNYQQQIGMVSAAPKADMSGASRGPGGSDASAANSMPGR